MSQTHSSLKWASCAIERRRPPFMLFHKPHLSIKTFCTSTKSLLWRTQIQQKQLATQVSSVLLQRCNWVPLLRTLVLSFNLTPSLFLQILHKTQSDPQITLDFFNWAKTNLGFQPDLKSYCKIIEISIGSGLYRPAKPLLDSVVQKEPTSALVESIVQACRGKGSQSHVLSFVLEAYADKGLFSEGLEVYKKIRVYGDAPSTRASNALLNAFEQANEVRLAWCFLGSVIRSGISMENTTWASVAQILCKIGKLETISRMLDAGIYSSAMYNLLVDSFCKRGNFVDAFHQLNQMYERNLDPGFSIHSSILDGACKYGDVKVIENIMKAMVEKGLLSECPSECSLTIQKFCDLGKTHAAEMFYRRARGDKVELENATYGCMLRAFSKGGRVKEAVEVYRTISEKGAVINDSCCYAFVSVLCEDDSSEDVCQLLKDIVQRGFSPRTSDLSQFIATQCKKARWREAEELLDVILEKGFLPDFVCCCSLVEHYCKRKRVGSAVALHDKMVNLEGKLDLATYNVLLNGLFAEGRIEEAIRVFDYMRRQNLLSSASFFIMISGLCRERELRRAMKLHDEMLTLGLKPDKAVYKRLITGFK